MAAQTFRFTYKSNADMKAKIAAANELATVEQKVIVEFSGDGQGFHRDDYWSFGQGRKGRVIKVAAKYIHVDSGEEGIAVICPIISADKFGTAKFHIMIVEASWAF